MARIGIVFSSGFFGFFAHAGFLSALREQGIVPIGCAGASSGAIMAAMAASQMSDDDIRDTLFQLRKSDFWDPDPWPFFFKRALTLFKGYTGYLRGARFGRLLEGIPAERIEDCPTPLMIVATNLSLQREEYFTRGPLVTAVQASGAVPMLFKPVERDGSLFVDGGIVNKAPVQGLADFVEPETIIVHFITSGNMNERSNMFLKRRMTPWHIHQLGFNISRQAAYLKECERVRQRGVDILEVVTDAPSLGPDSLRRGRGAYEKAKMKTSQILSRERVRLDI
jgi:NTE family protein